MEVKSSLRRAQSLKNVSPGHVRYQISVEAKTASQEETQKVTTDGDVPRMENIPSAQDETKTKLESLLKRNEMRGHPLEQSPHSGDAQLSRSRSMENLPRHRPGSISALRALFESKAVFQQEFISSHKTSSATTSNKTTVTPTVNGNAQIEESKTQTPPTTVDKAEEASQKVNFSVFFVSLFFIAYCRTQDNPAFI
ncbi:hypothetical protein SKAU_G00055730 [Synaphobranchus kaupii]|uniref:Uncharacterized protein n=1 Tax=Synaphobranchus kaupii TaxID=118154 RepID=A0A9Q1G3T6_SYNKA|nr:hypothetical protein SKAU_G00055730 [Synaphobranchus kaupii]